MVDPNLVWDEDFLGCMLLISKDREDVRGLAIVLVP